jgi:hypothetical protein
MNKFTMFTAFLFLMFVVTASKKDNSSKNNFRPEFYFTGEIAGKQVNYLVDDNTNTYSAGPFKQENSTDPDYDYYKGTVVGETKDIYKNNIYVTILKYFNHHPALPELFSMIHTGKFGYGVGDESNTTVDGAAIMYLDENGNQWSSEFGPQNGSCFSISEVTDYPGSAIMKVFKACFSCKLYDPTGTKSIQISNATIRGTVL